METLGTLHTSFGKFLMTRVFGKLFLLITLACLAFSAYQNSIFQKFVADSHIQLLDNQAARLSCLNLVGRTNAAHNHRDPVEYFTGKVDKTVPTVVVDRDPNSIPEALSFGASLVLCGHTHKGQFFPATFFTRLANGNHFFYGCEKFGDAYAVISSGAEYFQLPVRIGTDNEVVEIRLS